MLVANDDEYQLWFLEELFQSSKFKVWKAINGQEAFTQAQEIKAKNINLDLVVLDLNMPISNGYEACEKIVKLFRREERKAKEVVEVEGEDETPVMVALSSFVDSQVIEQTLETGFVLTAISPMTSDYIAKRISPLIRERREAITLRQLLD